VDDLDSQRARAARNQSLFREVNQRIAELVHRYAAELLPNSYLCECLNTECTQTLELSHLEYERVRRRGTRFFVLPGHDDPAVENVVEAYERYVVVEKIGVGAEIAESIGQRDPGRAG